MEIILTKLKDMPSGILTFAGEQYYSRYDPQKEADRFVDSLKINRHSICLLIAPGLPYLYRALQKKIPGIRCLSLQPTILAQYIATSKSISPEVVEEWIESNNLSLTDYLFKALTDIEAERIETIIWPPAYKHFREFCNTVVADIIAFVKLTGANVNTVSFFGMRWLKNIVSNLWNIDKLSRLPQSTGLVVLAGSGPGLNDCIDIMKSNRKNFILWSLPSSLRTLSYAGLKPDVVVSSDAGFWAGVHLGYLNTWRNDSVPPLLIAPSRAMLRPLWDESSIPVSLLCMDLPIEQFLFDSIWIGGKKRYLPESVLDRGTVAITALDLLEKCHRGTILTIGIDFAWKDLQSHTRPHTFDEATSGHDNRLSTSEFLRYFDRERQPSSKTPGIGWYRVEPLDLYRTWLNSGWKSQFNKVMDYNPSKVEKKFKSVDYTDIRNLLSKSRSDLSFKFGENVEVPKKSDRQKNIANMLKNYRKRLYDLSLMNNELQDMCLMLSRNSLIEYHKDKVDLDSLKQNVIAKLDSIIEMVSINDE